MSSTVKGLKVTFNPINDSNTFTSGDFVSGQVELEAVKECDIQALSIKFKAKAEVRWTERHGQTTVAYHSKNKYFSLKQYFIQNEKHKETDSERLLTTNNGETYTRNIGPGRYIYPFTFQFPMQNTPSSFQGSAGKIVYLLEACLSRSMRINKKDSTKLNFVSQDGVGMNTNPELRMPQHESKDKKLKFFNSGTVSMDVNIEKMGFYQGEGIKVFASIQNNSSREIRPKYCVYSKHSFFANGKKKLYTKDLLKEVGAPIAPSATTKVTQIINIPHDSEPSIHNCDIIKSEHRLRVYLDVKYASDPEIKFPITILCAHQFPASDFRFGNTTPPSYNLTSPAAPQPTQYMSQYPAPVFQPMSQPTSQPLFQPMFQPTAQPLSQPMFQPTSQPLSQPMFQLTSQPLSQPMFQPTSQPGPQASTMPVNPSDPPPPYSAYGMYPTMPQNDTQHHQ